MFNMLLMVATLVVTDVGELPPGTPPDAQVYRMKDLKGARVSWNYSPPEATAEKAQVVLSCQFDKKGRLHLCVVQDETPLGQGFGKAAALKTLKFQPINKTRNVIGEWKRFRWTWGDKK